MSAGLRRTLALVFIAGFLISAPLLVLYTAGYRLNFRTGRLVQTGVLSVGSVPRGAKVSVDGENMTGSTPLLIDDVLPGQHRVALSKAGYLPWTKSLPVQSRETTFIVDAVLTADAPASLIRSSSFTGFGISRETGRVAYEDVSGDWDEIWTYDPAADASKLLARFPAHRTQVASLVWSPDGSALAVSMGVGAVDARFLIDKDGKRRVALPNGPMSGWDAGASATAVVPADTGFSLKTLDGGTTNVPVPSEALRAWGGEYVLAQSAGDRTAIVRQRDSAGPASILTYVPAAQSVGFVPAPNGLIALRDEGRGHLILLDGNGGAGSVLMDAAATDWQWEPNGRRLLYTDGFELHLFDPDQRADETLTRVSDAITGIAWRPGVQAALYAQDGQITSLEFDRRDGRQATAVTQGSGIRAVWTDPKGRTAYFLGTANGASGVFARPLAQ